MLDETIQDQGLPSESPQGEPASGPVDVETPSIETEVAAGEEDTVKATSEPDASTGAEGGSDDPFKELLSRDEYVPKKDYQHAVRKITEQGQELRSRDDELTQAQARIQQLEEQIRAIQKPTPQTGAGYVPSLTPTAPGAGGAVNTPDVTDLRHQLTLLTDALLELNEKQESVSQILQKRDEQSLISRRYGITDSRIIERYEQLKAEGKVFEAHDLLRDAQEALKRRRDDSRKTEQSKQAKIVEGGGASPIGGARTSRVKSELPKEPTQRKLSRRERLLRNVGL